MENGELSVIKNVKIKMALNIVIAPIIAGILMFLAYAPYHYHIVSFISIFLLVLLIKDGKNVFFKSFFYYLAYALSILHDLTGLADLEGAKINIVMIFLLFVMFSTMFASIMKSWSYLHNKNNISIYWIAFFWFLFEEFKSVFLGGFPFIKIGGIWEGTFLNGLFPVIGESGVGFIVVLFVLLVYEVFLLKKYSSLILLFLLICISLLLSDREYTKNIDDNDVVLIQTNYTYKEKMLQRDNEKIINKINKIIKSQKPGDIIILPETVITAPEDILFKEFDDFKLISKDKLVIFGIPIIKTVVNNKIQEYSSASAVGLSNDVFLKEQLIPVAEYTPLYNWIKGLIGIKKRFGYVPYLGKKQKNIKWEKGEVAVFVCYEVGYDRLIRDRVNYNTGFISVIKNLADFKSSIKDILLQQIKVRSLESQRYTIFSGNTGFSGIIDKYGEVVIKSKKWKEEVLSGKIKIVEGMTPFLKYGNTILFLLMIILFIFEVIRKNSKRR